MAPDDAVKAIADGHTKRLMLDWHTDPNTRAKTFMLSPASHGRKGHRRINLSEMVVSFGPMVLFGVPAPKGQCVFFKNKLCSIHHSGYKPVQCRASFGCNQEVVMQNEDVAAMWDNYEAFALVKQWLEAVGLPETIFQECI